MVMRRVAAVDGPDVGCRISASVTMLPLFRQRHPDLLAVGRVIEGRRLEEDRLAAGRAEVFGLLRDPVGIKAPLDIERRVDLVPGVVGLEGEDELVKILRRRWGNRNRSSGRSAWHRGNRNGSGGRTNLCWG